MIGIGIIGYGYWGPNLVRNFSELDSARVVAVCDSASDRLAQVARRYPGVKTVGRIEELIGDPAIDAVAIATPAGTHFDLAMKVLKAGKHVLVEKPMTQTSEEALRLIDEAARQKRILMVDHTFVYTGAVRTVKHLASRGRLGKIYYYDSVRVNLGLFQHDVNVLWDLAVHDVSIMDYVVGAQPYAVSATGVAHLDTQHENVAYLTCFFEDKLIAHINVNWLAPVKIRRTLICGSRRMIVYNDLVPDEKIRIYDKGIKIENGTKNKYQQMVNYRTGHMFAPKLDRTEALLIEAGHFVECIEKNQTPITDGHAGLRVVRVLEAAVRSMAQDGSRVEIDLAGSAA